METYEEVADKAGLAGDARDRFIKYMRSRWANEEAIQSQTGYATEWAYRFKLGVEFACSDLIGRLLLAQNEK